MRLEVPEKLEADSGKKKDTLRFMNHLLDADGTWRACWRLPAPVYVPGDECPPPGWCSHKGGPPSAGPTAAAAAGCCSWGAPASALGSGDEIMTKSSLTCFCFFLSCKHLEHYTNWRRSNSGEGWELHWPVFMATQDSFWWIRTDKTVSSMSLQTHDSGTDQVHVCRRVRFPFWNR